MLNKIRLLLATLFLAGAVAGTAVACSSGPVDYGAPGTWYVSYQGQNYCGYIYDAHEVDMYAAQYGGLTCVRTLYPPMGAQLVPGTLGFALMDYRLRYATFYDSGYWYDQFYAPIGARYHVTVIQRNAYLSYAHDFDTRYAPQIKTASAKAKWSNGKTGAYTFPASNSNAKNKPLTNAGGGYSGTSNNNSGNSKYTSGNSGSTGKTGSNLGKTGTSSSSGKSGTSSNSGGFGSRRR